MPIPGFFRSARRVAEGFWNVVDRVDTKSVTYPAIRAKRRTQKYWGKFTERWMRTPANEAAGTAMVPYSRAGAALSAATAPFARHPILTKTGLIGGAGAYGYASSEGTPYQRAERAVGFAVGMGLGATGRGRSFVKSAFTPTVKATGGAMSPYTTAGYGAMVPYSKGAAAVSRARATVAGGRGLALGAGVGAMYGLMDDQTNVFTGAAVGMGGTFLARGAVRNIARGNYIGGGTGAAAGALFGLAAGGPVGMAVGAGLGGAGGGAFRFAKRHPTAAKRLGFTGLVAGGSTAIVGASAMQAYGMHQRPRDTNFGADGDLALGLHSLRHG